MASQLARLIFDAVHGSTVGYSVLLCTLGNKNEKNYGGNAITLLKSTLYF